MRYLARSGGLLGYAELVRRHGHDPNALLKAVGLPLTALENPDIYLSYPKLAALYEHTAQVLDEPRFALQLGLRQGLEVVGALGAWLCEKATIGEALYGLQRHLSFHARGIDVHLHSHGDQVELELSLAFAHTSDCQQLMLLSLALLQQGMRELQPNQETATAVWIRAQRPLPSVLRACEEFFRCSVNTTTPRYAIRFPLGLLSRSVAVSPKLRARLQQHWRDDWQLMPMSISSQVARCIAALLPTGDCSLSAVAQLIGLHSRTLQAKLKAEHTSFDACLRQVRLNLACTHLRDSDVDITRLALDMGYGDIAVFSRAFKQWTGFAPSQWRRDKVLTS